MTGTHYDVIIIGTGAGGGTLLHKLAPSGKRILVLERGGFIPREKDNWSSRANVMEEKYHAPEKFLDSQGKEFQPGTHYYVGGNTKFYGAALFRFREQDFGQVKHKGGISPAWPVSYNDFEPYYTEAEYLYLVHGDRGSDPTEPWASKPYRRPAVSHEPRMHQVVDGFAKLGCKPFPVPLGILIDEKDPHASKCIRCSTCDGYPCLVQAKADAQTICVEPALEYPNVTLLTNAYVERLETDNSGTKVSKVIVQREGVQEEYSADIVVSSGGAINSAALLLRSANSAHPRGLANSSDQVGRNYMAHNNTILFTFSLTPNPTLFQKTLAINDFYFGDKDWNFPMGHISMVGKFDGPMFKPGAPSFVPVAVLNQMGKYSIDFWLTSEDLPDPNNRVTVNARDRTVLTYKENNLEAHARLVAKVKHLIGQWQTGLHFEKSGKIPLGGVAHQCGTTRFGHDPKTSVIDIHCKAHDLDNLYIVDGGFFPSSNAVNPALTIMANALRVGDHLLQRLAAAATVQEEIAVQQKVGALA
ncbi:MAG TPA: GMC family oxidoreductase [Candidatus Angelobacter sp.]